MYEIIEKKKRGKELSREEISFVVEGYTQGKIPDYQMSAFLMAVYFKGMNIEETSHLTLAMANSGELIDLSPIQGIKVDKHSTGGVGDKTTLIVAPLVAAAGVKVAKMSGRGLGHTGGTIDKLESIPDFKTELSREKFIASVNGANIAVVSQSGNLAPADKKIYALRDVTATVDHVSLIASSVMSKKIASGAEAIVLDVKFGSGAFMKTPEEARKLAKVMVHIGRQVKRKTVALVTDMRQPLGYAVGNALEVKEAIHTLKGMGPKDLTDLSVMLASHMIVLSGVYEDLEEAKERTYDILKRGLAIEKLKEWITLQGGDWRVVDDESLLPQSKLSKKLKLKVRGYISGIDAEKIGKAALVLGAGRETKDSVIDHSVGIILNKKIGDYIEEDWTVATIYYNEKSDIEQAISLIQEAYNISQVQVESMPLIYEVIK
jgi:pyrimidine-nucleoside phosphorylase